MCPDPLSEAAVRRHELTGQRHPGPARARPVGAPVTFAGFAKAAGVSRSWLYTQPDISSQIRRLRTSTDSVGSAGTIPAGGHSTRRCGPGSPPPSTATSSSPTTTPGSAASSPAYSATSGQPGSDQVTIQTAETAAIRPRASRRRRRR